MLRDETPLPIWRPMVYFKYPDGPELTEAEILRLLELFRSVSSWKKSSPRCCQAHQGKTSMNSRETHTSLGHFNPESWSHQLCSVYRR